MDKQRADHPNNYVPSDYEDLYRYYIIGDGHGNSLCDKLIRGMLPYSTEDERETLKHDVFLRLLDKQMLRVFDPAKANFGGVIFFTTRTIVVNHLSRKSRNPITGLRGGSLVETHPEDTIFEPGVYSLDRVFGVEDANPEEAIELREVLSELFDWARALWEKPRHKRDESLFPLLKLLADQNDAKECAAALGVTPSTISNWLTILRDQLKSIFASREPA
jgi:DNA-binding transcriptional ArsR family regulator